MARHVFSRPRLAVAIFASVLGFACPTRAQVSEAARAAARELATEGVENFEAGEFTAASDKLNRAFDILRAPSLGLWSARALAKCAHWVQASERYLEVTRLDPKTGDEAVQRQAQADATREYAELAPRIPRLTLAVANAAPGELVVELDGAVLPTALLSTEVPVDPGQHVIEARQGSRFAKQLISVNELERLDVSLALPPLPETPSAPAPPAPHIAFASSARARLPDRVRTVEREPNTALWLSLSSAGAGIAVGGVTGILALQAHAATAPYCPGGVCDPKYRDQVNRLNALRTASTVAFSVGGVGIMASGVLWLTGPRAQSPARPYVRASVGLQRVSIEGAF